MPHIPGHNNPFWMYNQESTPQSIPTTSNILPPPQPTTSVGQLAQPKQPPKERGGFFDPLISKEAVQERIPGVAGTVLGTAAEFTTSPFDIAMIPTWAFGGPAISTTLKGAKTLAFFPQGLKWVPKVLGSLFDPFPGTKGNLPARLLAETGASIGGGFLGTEMAEFGEDVGGLPGAIIMGLGGGLVGGTIGGLGAVGGMKAIGQQVARMRGGGTHTFNPKNNAALYNLVTGRGLYPSKTGLEIEVQKAIATAEKENVLPSDIWVRKYGEETTKRLESGLAYYEPPEWIRENFPDLIPNQSLLETFGSGKGQISAAFRPLVEDPHELQIDQSLRGDDLVSEIDNKLNPATVHAEDLNTSIDVSTNATSAGRLGKSVERLDRLTGGVLSRLHRLGNPMSKARTLMEKLSVMKNMGEKNASITAHKFYEWTGLWKMDDVFGKTDKNIWAKNEFGQDVGNVKVGTLEDGGELKEAAKKAGIFNADNLSVLRILEETDPLNNRWYTVKKGGAIDGKRDYRKLLNEEQKEMLRRIAIANEYSRIKLESYGIEVGFRFTAKSDLSLQDVFGWTKSMLDEAAEDMKNSNLTPSEKEWYGSIDEKLNHFNQDVNYANRRIVVHEKTGDIAIVGKDDRVWKLGKRIGAEYSRKFNRITTAEAAGYTYMPLDSAFIIGMTSKHKRALYESMAKYMRESIEKGSYEEYKDIEVMLLEDRTKEMLFQDLRKLYPKKYSDKNLKDLIASLRGGDLTAEPEQILMKNAINNLNPKIRYIRKLLASGESIRGLSYHHIDTLKEIWTEFPHLIVDAQGQAISDLFDDKDGLKALRGLKEIMFADKPGDESFNEIMSALKIETEDEAEFLVTLAWARRIMGDKLVLGGGKIRDVDLNKITEIIDGKRLATKEDAAELRKLIDYYKDSVSDASVARIKEIEAEIENLNQLQKKMERATTVWYDGRGDLDIGIRINKLQAQLVENQRLQHQYKRFGDKNRLDFIDEDFKMGLKYRKDGWDAKITADVFTKEQERLLNLEGVDDAVAVQSEDIINTYNEFIDGALIKARQKLNYETGYRADPEAAKNLERALFRLEKKLSDTLKGWDEYIEVTDPRTGKPRMKLVHRKGIQEMIDDATIRAQSGLGSIFLDQPAFDKLMFDTKVNAPQGSHEVLTKMRNDFNKIFEELKPTQKSEWWTAINAVQRMVALGFDASIFMIQLFPVVMNHPTIMPKVFKGYFKALLSTWKDPDAGRRLLFEYRNKPENARVLQKYGRWLLMSEDNEVFDLLATGKMGEAFQKATQVGGRKGAIAKEAARFGGGFKNSFDHVLDIAGIEIAKALDGVVDGTNPETIERQVKAVADYANAMRGLFSSQAAGVSSVQRYKEAQWLLAARYRRAIASLYAMALNAPKAQPERAFLASKALISLTTGTIMSAIVLQMMQSYAEGDSEDEIFEKVEKLMDVTTGGFLMFQAGGQSIGIGSKFVSDAKMIGKALTFMGKKATGEDVDEWINFLSMERTNPGLQWVRSQLAFAPTTAWGILSGKEYMGDPAFRPGESNFDTLTNFAGPLSDAVIPIWMSSALFEGAGQKDWGGRSLRGFSEAFGMRTHPQSTTEIMRLAAYEYMGMPFDSMEPFQKDLVRYMLVDDLTGRQEEQVKNGVNQFAIYFNNIKRIETEYQNGLIKLTEIYPNTAEGNRNMYTQYRGLKSMMRGQKKERGYDLEFNSDRLNDKDPNKRALAQYYALYELATTPGTQVIDWDLWQEEFDKLMATLSLEQQVAVTRNSHDLPMPEVFMQRLARIGKKEYRRIRHAQFLREEYFRAMGRDDLAELMNKYHNMIED